MKILNLEISKCNECPYVHQMADLSKAKCDHANAIEYPALQVKTDAGRPYDVTIPDWCPLEDKAEEPVMARLRNGSEESAALVQVTMMSIQKLMDTMPLMVYEFIEKARDSEHKLFGSVEEVLKQRCLVRPDGSIHDSIRNIALSMADGNGIDMELVSPVVKEKP